jgi:hypothetical protein
MDKRFALLLAAGLAVIGIGACSDDDDVTPTTEPTAGTTVAAPESPTAAASSSSSGQSARAYPAGKRTGDADVDAVIDAVLSGDPAKLGALFLYYSLGCKTEPLGIGAPPKCDPGAAEGTPVDVFPNGSCPEGRFSIRGDGTLERLLAQNSARLYAVYRRAPVQQSGLEWPRGSIGIVFIGGASQGDQSFWLELDGGHVVVAGVGCPGQPPEQLTEIHGATGFLLPPL